MRVFSKLTLASVSVLALLTLAACGNPPKIKVTHHLLHHQVG